MVLAAGLGHPAAADHLRDAEADGAGAEPAGDGAHRRGCSPATASARRSPTCTGSRRRSRATSATARPSASSSPTAARSSCSGPPAGCATPPDFLGDSFLVVSGDALTDIDFAAMREFHESHDGIATLATKRVADTDQFGVVIAGADGRIQGFQEKPDPAEALSDLANCCIYMFRSEIFDFFPEPGTSKAAGPGRPARLRRLGDGRLPGAAGGRRALLLARDRRLLERHRQPRRAAPGQPRRAARRGRGRAGRARGGRRRPRRQPARRRRGRRRRR